MISDLVLGAPSWVVPAASLAAIAAVVLLLAYRRAPASAGVKVIAIALKTLALAALLLCLIDPLTTVERPRPGENLFLILADDSQSLSLPDRAGGPSRGEVSSELLAAGSPWQEKLGEIFDLRRYTFDLRLDSVADFSGMSHEGNETRLGFALEQLAKRYRHRPVAGILLLTDGNATDRLDDVLASGDLPPIYPVLLGEPPEKDLAVRRVTVSQTSFETSPVTIGVEVESRGFEGEEIVAQLEDESGEFVSELSAIAPDDGRSTDLRFQLKPEELGLLFYKVRVFARDDAEESSEATTVNNERWALVDRGGGPYRVLYVSGRPNWELKFLRRSLEADPEVELVGLIRIARSEPKFEFLGRGVGRANPLFKGTGAEGGEDAETYDEPVLIRLATEDAEELAGGFPKTRAELFRYHAVILDDLEAGFFTTDQLSLLRDFVSLRGGGLLMLGGPDSFAEGSHARTPIGDLLPVYLERSPAGERGEPVRLRLTRDGWLQPWVRLRTTEEAEQRRLQRLPAFHSLNRVRGLKPGAVELIQAVGHSGQVSPALAVQRFGRGRTAALLVGDLWRWHLRRRETESSDLAQSWRQTVRWLTGDVPRRVEVETERESEGLATRMLLRVAAQDAEFQPLDGARVAVEIQRPGGERRSLEARASDEAAGTYSARALANQAGPYRAEVRVEGPDGAEVGVRETGWIADPAARELERIAPDAALVKRLADETGGRVVSPSQLEELAAELPVRSIPVTETSLTPLWHRWWLFVFAVACLCGEWLLRRMKGLA